MTRADSLTSSLTRLGTPRVALTLGMWAGYVFFFRLLSDLMGPGVGALVVFPVLATGWFWGLRAGLGAGVGCFFLNMLLFKIFLPDLGGWTAILREGGAPGHLVAVFIGTLFGYLRDLKVRVETQRALLLEAHQRLLDEQAKLHHAARHDPLTGLPNRLFFLESLEETVSVARRAANPAPFAVLFIDLDGFKSVNDHHGHAVGDALLKGVAERFRGGLREGDMLARMGGDEFTVLLELQGPEAARAKGDALAQSLRRPFFLPAEVRVGASVGVSLYPRDGEDVESLLRRADHAMYEAKRYGAERAMRSAH